MEKKIVFVVREGLAVRNIEGNFKTFNGVGSVTAILEGLKETLSNIPTNAEGLAQDFITIYVPDVMNGLLSNSIGLYLRNGKTASGKVIEKAELNLYVEVHNLLAERSYNARLYNLKYVSKEDGVTKTLIKNTWSALDREERKIMLAGRANAGIGVAPQFNTQPQQPSPEMIAMQQQMQMMQQMMQGFMSMMGGQMPQMPNMNMQAQETTVPTTPVAPVSPVTTLDIENNTQATQVESFGAPTTLNVDLTKTPQAPVVEEYEPEF